MAGGNEGMKSNNSNSTNFNVLLSTTIGHGLMRNAARSGRNLKIDAAAWSSSTVWITSQCNLVACSAGMSER
jgi:hypothetical protein